MIPAEFPEQTTILHANPNQTEIDGLPVGALPIFSDGQQVVSCWRMSFIERCKAFLFGRVWIGIHSGHTQPPVWVDVCQSPFQKEQPK